jgi:hypothetical protein
MNEAGFVVIGHAVKNVGFNNEVNDIWDQQNGGYDVLFKVDSVIKGNLNLKTIVIKQFGGNCDRIFKFGKKYLIVGNQLETFVNKTPKRKKIKEGEIPPNSMPPPPPSVNSKTAIFNDGSDDEMRYWNNLANEHVILNTSMCSSFLVNSKNASYFLGN